MAQSSNRKKTKKKRRTNNGAKLILVVVIVLCCVLMYSGIGMKEQIRQNAEVIADLNAQIEVQKQLTEDLEKQGEYINTDDYIEEIARDKLGLVYDNEIVFKRKQE